MFTACDRGVKRGDGLVGDGVQRGFLQRKIRREPGVFGQRQYMSERRTFGDAARDEIGRLQRKFRRAPALRQGRKLAPWRGIGIPARPRPGQHQPVAVALLAEPVEPTPRGRLIHAGEPPPAMAHGIQRLGFAHW